MFKKQRKSVMTEDYKTWRSFIFSIKPGSVEFLNQEPKQVYGAVMDIGIADINSASEFWLTTSAFVNGEATFSPSPGGRIMGLGTDPRVAEVAKSIVAMSQIFMAKAQPVDANILPAVGRVAFRFLTTSGIFGSEDDLKVYQSGPYNQLLTRFGQIRAVAERAIDQRMQNNKK